MNNKKTKATVEKGEQWEQWEPTSSYLASAIEEVLKFRTSDDNLYSSREQAEEHEKEIIKARWATEQLKKGCSIADIARAVGMEVPDEILEQITKDSKLVISHWQCQDKAGYKPCFFNTGMSIYVYGDAGGWSGSYGGDMSLRDLARYAKTKGSIL